ncbi:MAG: LysE family translocator [Roseitalea sp.]|jgi:threonine/homoserine/homoserine lactone efflux protein|nr:LysE family translocator [Roseitalea sp.]MBO6723043.1 LysE family translocator [Roseitalea sp.]MBO6744081.1 LysE family translocator [Roseitalea sp.]
MIDQTTLITYLAILLGFVLIPGPAVILTLARASSAGTRVGVATGLGIAAGDLVHTAMAVIGLSAIILASATLFTLIKYLGAAYLVYLGIRAILEKPQTDLANGGAISITPKQAFRQAIIAEVLNPKSALFFVAFLPQFVDPSNGLVALQLTILGVLFVLMGLLSTLLVAITAGRFGLFLRRNPVILKWQGKVVGSIYCALGARLALQER